MPECLFHMSNKTTIPWMNEQKKTLVPGLLIYSGIMEYQIWSATEFSVK
jgi:hypothetical protein